MVVASVEVIDELLPHREMLQKTATMLSDDIQVANLASKVLINLGKILCTNLWNIVLIQQFHW